MITLHINAVFLLRYQVTEIRSRVVWGRGISVLGDLLQPISEQHVSKTLLSVFQTAHELIFLESKLDRPAVRRKNLNFYTTLLAILTEHAVLSH